MTDDEIAEVGEKMLDILDERGWCQDLLSTPDGQVCLRGAMFQALTGKPQWAKNSDPAYLQYIEIDNRLALYIATEELTTTPCSELVPGFNNSESTTVEDVKLVIKRALIEPSLSTERKDTT